MARLRIILKRVFIHNAGLKVVALVLAMVLYFIAREETIREPEIEIPVVVTGRNAERTLVTQPPDELRVRVRGNVQKLTEILARRTPYEVDLSDYRDNQTVFLIPSKLEEHLGEGVKVLSVSPSSFTLEFDEMKVKRVPVAVNILKVPGPYWLIVREKMVTEPRFVEVAGPGSVLARIKQYHTEPLDLSNVTRDYTGKVTLESRQHVRVLPTSVQITIPVIEKQGALTLKGARVHVKGCPSGYTCSATPGFLKVKVEGMERLVDQVTRENVSQYVYVDASRLPVEPEVLQKHFPAVEPTVEPLQGVRFTLTGPKYFNVTVTRQ